MKNILFVSALIAGLATAAVAEEAAVAEDFEATQVETTFSSGLLDFTLNTEDGDLNSITTGVHLFEYSMGRFDSTTYSSLSYGVDSDTFNLAVNYNLETELSPVLTAYGTAQVAYVTPTDDLSGGDAFFTPTLGVAYTASDKLKVFSDVSYSWNMSQDWSDSSDALALGSDYYLYGTYELGVEYAVNDSLVVRPSLIRSFNTDNDVTNVKLEAALKF